MLSPEAHIEPAPENHEVLFCWLANHGDHVERTVTMPANRAMLLPVINYGTSYLEDPSLESDIDLIRRAKDDIDGVHRKYAEFDGVVEHAYRVATDVFDLHIGESNCFGVPSGNTRAVSDGYWIFIRTIPPGRHEVVIIGACSSGQNCITARCHIDAI